MSRSRWRTLLRAAEVVAIGIVGLILVSAVLPTDAPASYRAIGEPMDLPRRPLAPVSRRDFDRILVGLQGKPVVVNLWARPEARRVGQACVRKCRSRWSPPY